MTGLTAADHARAAGRPLILSKVGNRPPLFPVPLQASQICALGSFSIAIPPAFDPDGDPMTYEWRASYGRLLPSGLSARLELDSDSCALETPIDVVITVHDGNGGFDQAVVRLTGR